MFGDKMLLDLEEAVATRSSNSGGNRGKHEEVVLSTGSAVFRYCLFDGLEAHGLVGDFASVCRVGLPRLRIYFEGGTGSVSYSTYQASPGRTGHTVRLRRVFALAVVVQLHT